MYAHPPRARQGGSRSGPQIVVESSFARYIHGFRNRKSSVPMLHSIRIPTRKFDHSTPGQSPGNPTNKAHKYSKRHHCTNKPTGPRTVTPQLPGLNPNTQTTRQLKQSDHSTISSFQTSRTPPIFERLPLYEGIAYAPISIRTRKEATQNKCVRPSLPFRDR